MTERLLQFIWQFQYFNRFELRSVAGESVSIIHPGQFNSNQGPDFLDAKIKIDTTTWAGSVEIHIVTSDWEKHKHQADKNYDNVILHVVWEHDAAKNTIPVLELKDRISNILLDRYEELMNASTFIPCENAIAAVNEITWLSWKDRLLAERLSRKSILVDNCLAQNNFHWEETFWWLLARNFGYKVNGEAFELIARSLPMTILAKHKNQVQQLESLFLGQAGLLENVFEDDYAKLLQREYRFLKNKYNLQPVHHPIHFLRMRPGNFPTIRLAQLAMLIKSTKHLFAGIKDEPLLTEVREWFNVTANDYWHYHYRLDDDSSFKKKKLGETMIDNIIINTISPILFAYGNYHQESKFKEKALQWLEEVAAETNSISNGFKQIGVVSRTAFDSQGLIELKNEYCDAKKCLECGIGNAILKL